ncbi:MAG: hypothetical protein JNJ83_00455 [Verrucomicrobiaceae bacterium]|nr:hypothetical protein [Verrucomicrobiaceae bacterium]
MPAPLRWDTNGLTWDSGSTWDEQQSNNRKSKLMNTKAVTYFGDYTEASLSPVSRAIHTALTANAATFGTLPVTLVALDALIDDYDTKLAAKADKSKSSTVAFRVARENLEEALNKLGNHVNNVAEGDPVIVTESGFPSYNTNHTPDENPPAAPTNVRLSYGKVTGTLVVRYKTDRSPSMNEIQLCTGDPMNEAAWQGVGFFQGGRAQLSDLTAGAIVWVRIRTLGLKNTVSDWSDPAQIRMV